MYFELQIVLVMTTLDRTDSGLISISGSARSQMAACFINCYKNVLFVGKFSKYYCKLQCLENIVL